MGLRALGWGLSETGTLQVDATAEAAFRAGLGWVVAGPLAGAL